MRPPSKFTDSAWAIPPVLVDTGTDSLTRCLRSWNDLILQQAWHPGTFHLPVPFPLHLVLPWKFSQDGGPDLVPTHSRAPVRTFLSAQAAWPHRSAFHENLYWTDFLTNNFLPHFVLASCNWNQHESKTMQSMWTVRRENGQMSNLQGALPIEMVSCWIIVIFVSFFSCNELMMDICVNQTSKFLYQILLTQPLAVLWIFLVYTKSDILWLCSA